MGFYPVDTRVALSTSRPTFAHLPVVTPDSVNDVDILPVAGDHRAGAHLSSPPHLLKHGRVGFEGLLYTHLECLLLTSTITFGFCLPANCLSALKPTQPFVPKRSHLEGLLTHISEPCILKGISFSRGCLQYSADKILSFDAQGVTPTAPVGFDELPNQRWTG